MDGAGISWEIGGVVIRRLEGIVLVVVMNDRIVVESKVIDDFQICNSCADIFFRRIFLHSLNWNKNSNRGKRLAGSKPCRQ